MTTQKHEGGWVIIASFIIAYALIVFPLPDWAELARPQWAALILIYWCMAMPDRVSVGVGWTAGLFQDALQSSLLGEHALAYAVIAFLTVKLHQRIRIYPLTQQALSVLVLLLLARLIQLWINGFVGRPPVDWQYWLPSIIGTLLWPWVFIVMRDMRRRFGVR